MTVSELSPLQAMKKWFGIAIRSTSCEFMEFAKKNNLSLVHLRALFIIQNFEGCGISDLGNTIGISTAAASQMVDRLVKMNMLKRTENQTDRRIKHIEVTDHGMKILQSGHKHSHWIETLFETLNHEEQELVGKSFKMLVQKSLDLIPNAFNAEFPHFHKKSF